jgi:hypothetical protein
MYFAVINCWNFHTFCRETDRSLNRRIFFIEQVFAIFHQAQQFFFILSWNGNNRVCLPWNGITHIAAFPTCQACFVTGNCLADKANQQFVGIGTPFIDFQSGMPTTQAFQRNLNSDIAFFGSYLLIFQCSSDIHTACTTDIQLAFIFRIEIQKDFSVHCPRLQTERAVHTGFFVFGNQCFQRTMFQIFRFKHSHDSSHAKPVICSQRSSFGLYPVAIYISFDRIFFKIVHRIVILLRNHVHVCLKNHTFPVFHSRSCRFTDNYVTCFVYKRFQSQAFSEVNQKFCYFFHVSRRTGNLCQRIKMLPYVLWS